MSPQAPTDIRQTLCRLIGEIAPEANLSTLKPDVALRDQLDLDSMDFLNLVIALHQAFGVDIPESDYAHLATLDGCLEYFSRRLNARRDPT